MSVSPITISGTVTSFLPLTTAWPSQAGCDSELLCNDAPGTTLSFLFLYFNDPKYANVIPGAPTCLPPEVSSWWYQQAPTSTVPTITMLGGYTFKCPDLYYTVYSSTAFDSMTTLVGCCPSSFTYRGLYAGNTPAQCVTSHPAAMVTYAQLSGEGIYTISSASVGPFVMAGVQVNGYIFRDAAVTTPPSNTGAATSAAGSTSSSTSPSHTGATASAASSPSILPASSGLSSGAKVGIVVGAALVGAVLVAVTAWFLIRRKRRAAAANPAPTPELGGPHHEPKLGANGRSDLGPGSVLLPAELGAVTRRRAELDAENIHQSPRDRSELP